MIIVRHRPESDAPGREQERATLAQRNIPGVVFDHGAKSVTSQNTYARLGVARSKCSWLGLHADKGHIKKN